jgi:hypothetical protein
MEVDRTLILTYSQLQVVISEYKENTAVGRFPVILVWFGYVEFFTASMHTSVPCQPYNISYASFDNMLLFLIKSGLSSCIAVRHSPSSPHSLLTRLRANIPFLLQ